MNDFFQIQKLFEFCTLFWLTKRTILLKTVFTVRNVLRELKQKKKFYTNFELSLFTNNKSKPFN